MSIVAKEEELWLSIVAKEEELLLSIVAKEEKLWLSIVVKEEELWLSTNGAPMNLAVKIIPNGAKLELLEINKKIIKTI